MRILIIFLVTLFFYNCQDNKAKMITNDVNTSIEKLMKNDSINELKKDNFLLTDKNMMQFLLDYGEKNQENLVRIITDYGSIDIILFEKTKLTLVSISSTIKIVALTSFVPPLTEGIISVVLISTSGLTLCLVI